MKKKVIKKLVLSKETVVNLQNSEQQDVKGGVYTYYCTAPYTCMTVPVKCTLRPATCIPEK